MPACEEVQMCLFSSPMLSAGCIVSPVIVKVNLAQLINTAFMLALLSSDKAVMAMCPLTKLQRPGNTVLRS